MKKKESGRKGASSRYKCRKEGEVEKLKAGTTTTVEIQESKDNHQSGPQEEVQTDQKFVPIPPIIPPPRPPPIMPPRGP